VRTQRLKERVRVRGNGSMEIANVVDRHRVSAMCNLPSSARCVSIFSEWHLRRRWVNTADLPHYATERHGNSPI
jgi:hypothetical protein